MAMRIASRGDAPHRGEGCLIYFAPPFGAEEAGREDGRGFAAPGLLRDRRAHQQGLATSGTILRLSQGPAQQCCVSACKIDPLRGVIERLARRRMCRLGQGARSPRAKRADDLGGVRGGAPEAHSLSRPLRRIPRRGRPRCRRPAWCGSTTTDIRRAQAPSAVRSTSTPTPTASSSARTGGSSPSTRTFGRGRIVYDPWHYVPVLARKPGALRNAAPFKNWVLPAALDRVRRNLAGSDDGDRQMAKDPRRGALQRIAGDRRPSRPPHPPLRHRRDRKRELALQEPRLSCL